MAAQRGAGVAERDSVKLQDALYRLPPTKAIHPTRTTDAKPAVRPLRVLLAEDHAVNQKLGAAVA